MGKQLFDALDVEWKTSGVSRSSTKHLRGWNVVAFDEFDDCAELVAAINTRGNAVQSDELLAIVVDRASKDDLAARIVLQALMPGMRSLSFRYRRLDDVAATVVAETFHRIRTYPFDRRPKRIAANVLMDVRQQLYRAVQRTTAEALVSGATITRSPAVIDLLQVIQTGVREGVVTASDASIIVRSRILDEPVGGRSASNVGRSSARQRRFRAEQRLKTMALSAEK